MNTPICDRVAKAMEVAPGHTFQDRDAWEKVARRLERDRKELIEALRFLLGPDFDTSTPSFRTHEIRELARALLSRMEKT